MADQADTLIDEGERLEQAGDHASAMISWRKAQALLGPSHPTAMELELVIQDVSRKSGLLAPPLAPPPPPKRRTLSPSARRLLAGATVAIAIVALAVWYVKTRTTIVLTTSPAAAIVTLDGTVEGRAPLTLTQLSPGRHVLTLALKWHEPLTKIVDTPAGSTVPVNVTLAGRIVQVTAQGTGDYKTLPDAIAAAPDGATIHLAAGTYNLQEPLELSKSIQLEGDGSERTRILCSGQRFMIHLIGERSFGAKGIGFEQSTQSEAGSSDVLVAEDGEIDLENCSFKGAAYDPKTRKGGDGVKVGQHATSLKMIDCLMERNGGDGVSVRGAVTVEISGCRCLSNGMSGIVVAENSQGTIENNDCNENRLDGITVRNNAAPTLTDNRCTSNRGNGIHFGGSSGGTATTNKCRENGVAGIAVEHQATPDLEQNVASHNREVGIGFLDRAGGKATRNVVERNAKFGIAVHDHAHPTLIDNTCSRNGEIGLVYMENAGGTARHNTIHDNQRCGLYVAATASPSLDGNDCFGPMPVADERRSK